MNFGHSFGETPEEMGMMGQARTARNAADMRAAVRPRTEGGNNIAAYRPGVEWDVFHKLTGGGKLRGDPAPRTIADDPTSTFNTNPMFRSALKGLQGAR